MAKAQLDKFKRLRPEDSRDAALKGGHATREQLGGQEPAPATIDVTASPDAAQGHSLQLRAATLMVVDQRSHEQALEMIQGAKKLKRAIEEHWSKIKRNVDELKRNLLALERKDLAPVQAVIDALTPRALDYSNAEDRRIREEEQRRRQAAEEQARRDRQAELDRQEQEALRLEVSSPKLSAREEVFVKHFASSNQARLAALDAGYADPDKAGARLIITPKILEAIGNARQALELRQQATATAQKPLDVVRSTKVESKKAYVPGTRTVTTYACEVTDPAKFILAYLAGDIDTQAMVPNQVWLNKKAVDLKDQFETVFPGCTLVKNQTIAG